VSLQTRSTPGHRSTVPLGGLSGTGTAGSTAKVHPQRPCAARVRRWYIRPSRLRDTRARPPHTPASQTTPHITVFAPTANHQRPFPPAHIRNWLWLLHRPPVPSSLGPNRKKADNAAEKHFACKSAVAVHGSNSFPLGFPPRPLFGSRAKRESRQRCPKRCCWLNFSRPSPLASQSYDRHPRLCQSSQSPAGFSLSSLDTFHPTNATSPPSPPRSSGLSCPITFFAPSPRLSSALHPSPIHVVVGSQSAVVRPLSHSGHLRAFIIDAKQRRL